MHLNFAFTTRQVLWTLNFASELILLVVLLGRDRMRRYPWFTAGVALFALRLLAEVLLSGRMAMIPLQAIFITLADLAALVGLLVVVEVARRAFAGAGKLAWGLGIAVAVGLAAGVLALWGPWPHWKELGWTSLLERLQLGQLMARKGETLADVLTVELGLLVVLFGRGFKAGWRSHTQMIAIGLSTVSISMLAVQGVGQLLSSVLEQRHGEYEHILGLWAKVLNANIVVHLAVLVWWIVWLWLDEPGTRATEAAPAVAVVAPDLEPTETVEENSL